MVLLKAAPNWDGWGWENVDPTCKLPFLTSLLLYWTQNLWTWLSYYVQNNSPIKTLCVLKSCIQRRKMNLKDSWLRTDFSFVLDQENLWKQDTFHVGRSTSSEALTFDQWHPVGQGPQQDSIHSKIKFGWLENYLERSHKPLYIKHQNRSKKQSFFSSKQQKSSPLATISHEIHHWRHHRPSSGLRERRGGGGAQATAATRQRASTPLKSGPLSLVP